MTSSSWFVQTWDRAYVSNRNISDSFDMFANIVHILESRCTGCCLQSSNGLSKSHSTAQRNSSRANVNVDQFRNSRDINESLDSVSVRLENSCSNQPTLLV